MIQAYKSHTPKIAKTAYVHPSAVIIGDVTIGEYTNIWPGAQTIYLFPCRYNVSHKQT